MTDPRYLRSLNGPQSRTGDHMPGLLIHESAFNFRTLNMEFDKDVMRSQSAEGSGHGRMQNTHRAQS
jgi:hypothetical protein